MAKIIGLVADGAKAFEASREVARILDGLSPAGQFAILATMTAIFANVNNVPIDDITEMIKEGYLWQGN